ncbi:hypothetical protein Pelo_1232 [Pelomyxa schiedti]|nr:hypothetical protein Pelo_1232 [Pelomyxa schiedti]
MGCRAAWLWGVAAAIGIPIITWCVLNAAMAGTCWCVLAWSSGAASALGACVGMSFDLEPLFSLWVTAAMTAARRTWGSKKRQGEAIINAVGCGLAACLGSWTILSRAFPTAGAAIATSLSSLTADPTPAAAAAATSGLVPSIYPYYARLTLTDQEHLTTDYLIFSVGLALHLLLHCIGAMTQTRTSKTAFLKSTSTELAISGEGKWGRVGLTVHSAVFLCEIALGLRHQFGQALPQLAMVALVCFHSAASIFYMTKAVYFVLWQCQPTSLHEV